MKTDKKTPFSARRTSRAAAVQALYQIEQTNDDTDRVIFDMITDQFNTLTLEDSYQKPDIDFFKRLVHNTMRDQEKEDEIITQFLSANWRIERLSSVTRAILRLAVYELLNEKLIPYAIILYEYVEISKDFCEVNEVAFVNGILDRMAKSLRQTE